MMNSTKKSFLTGIKNYLLMFAISLLTSFLAISFEFRFSYRINALWKSWIPLYVMLFVFSIFISNYVNTRKDFLSWQPTSEKWLLSVVILQSTYLIYIVLKTYVNAFAVPFLLISMLLCALTGKQTALVITVLSHVAFALTTLSTYFISSMHAANAIVATGYALQVIGSLLYIKLYNVNETVFEPIKLAVIIAPVQYIINFLVLLLGYSVSSAALQSLSTLIGVASSIILYFTLLPILSTVFHICTNYKLMEYCDFDNPLLKQLAREAPGTFNHCLVVGNLSEACANAIGENSMLARVCAYYHDMGKLTSPEYFGENLEAGKNNPHEQLIPEVSVSVITKHTEDGKKLILKNHMPAIVADVAEQHHGDQVLRYFYNKAQNLVEEPLSDANYRYNNPRPKSKIAVIVMITDTIEAASRANLNNLDYMGMKTLIKKLILEKITTGQFDECDITLNEIRIIEDTIIEVLPGIYHNRISYANRK